MKKKSKLEKSTQIIENAKTTQWCYVNTDNEFTFMNTVFHISEDVEEYKVNNKAEIDEDGELNHYTNEAYMEEILVVLDENDKILYYNQDFDEIDKRFVSVVE